MQGWGGREDLAASRNLKGHKTWERGDYLPTDLHGVPTMDQQSRGRVPRQRGFA